MKIQLAKTYMIMLLQTQEKRDHVHTAGGNTNLHCFTEIFAFTLILVEDGAV